MPSCFDVANYFLECQKYEAGEFITNMKLQKLVYYAQGIYLAMRGEPLFNEKIYAWDYGPVCNDLYQKYKHHESNPIPRPDDINMTNFFDIETQKILDMVYEHYGKYSAWGLSEMSHKEPIWIDAYNRRGAEITPQSMQEYFFTQIDSDEDNANKGKTWDDPDSIMNTQRIKGDFVYYTRDQLYDE